MVAFPALGALALRVSLYGEHKVIKLMGFLLGTVSVAAGLWVLSNTTEGGRVATNAQQAITDAWERVAARVPATTQAFPSRVKVTESGSRTWREF